MQLQMQQSLQGQKMILCVPSTGAAGDTYSVYSKRALPMCCACHCCTAPELVGLPQRKRPFTHSVSNTGG